MRRATTLFSEQQRHRVDQAVTRAEAATSAEIVPVVARASGRYDRAEDVAGLGLGLAAMACIWLLLPAAHEEPGSWGQRSTALNLAMLVGATVGGFVLGAIVAAYVPWLRRLFTPRQQMREEVAANARRVFFDARVHHTAGHGGLLIYIALYERMALLLADQNILERLGQPALDELCARLTAGLRSGDVIEPLCNTIEEAGSRLAPVLPIEADDRNEIANTLITID